MKKLTEKQTEINYQLTKLIVDNADDTETKDALVSARCAFLNYIKVGEKTQIKTERSGKY